MTQPIATDPSVSLRARGQVRAYVLVTLFVLSTIGSAGLTVMMPSRPRPPADSNAALHAELAKLVDVRRARIAELQQTLGDRCDRMQAPQLARLLVMDGRWAQATQYADAYEARCGADPNVRKWGDAPIVAYARIK